MFFVSIQIKLDIIKLREKYRNEENGKIVPQIENLMLIYFPIGNTIMVHNTSCLSDINAVLCEVVEQISDFDN